MRLHVQNILHLITSEVGLIFLLLAFAVSLASVKAHAQDTWQVDAQHSIARLSLGSGPTATEVGIARVSGSVAFATGHAADPVVDLNIEPEQSPASDDPKISFKSKRSMVTGDGKTAVVGDLSVTRIERSVTMDANEGYYGAVYGEPVVHTDTREVTLVLPAATIPAAQNGGMQLSASTSVGREYFPELLAALAPGNWPSTVVEDESCTVPSVTGEGYFGANCTGTPVATPTNSTAPATAVVGEGYYGFEPTVIPDGSRATVALDLKLVPASARTSAASRAAATQGN